MIPDVIIDTVVALTIGLSMGYIHEQLHLREARRLGCEVKKADFIKNELVIETKTLYQSKRIASAPYKVLVPLNMIILALGLFFYPKTGSIGIIVGSGFTLFAHAVTYKFEGRSEKKNV